ncbi:MAG: M56 family metallopeptidase [Cyclobacteriaceae bacterium]
MNFLLQSSLCLVLFYSLYYFLLRKNTFFDLQRGYLLSVLILSLVIPAIDLDLKVQSDIAVLETVEKFKYLPDLSFNEMQEKAVNPVDIIILLYGSGVAFMFLRMTLGLLKVRRTLKNGVKRNEEGDCLVISNHDFPISSFYKYIFLNPSIEFDREEMDHILIHERKHISSHHFFDLLVVGLYKAFYWFNPVIYLFSYELKKVHEFVCDRTVTRQKQQKNYEKILIKSLFKTSALSMLSSLNSVSIKTRINMMNKAKSPKIKMIGFAMIIPFIAAMLFAFNSVGEDSGIEFTRNKKLTGNVTSEGGKPLPGVEIRVDGTARTVTDLFGQYELEVSAKSKKLEFSFPGFKTFVSSIPGKGTLDVQLEIGTETNPSKTESKLFPSGKLLVEDGTTYLVGEVNDKDGNPLKGVDVIMAKQKLKTTTDSEGKFRLKLSNAEGIVVYGIPDENGVYWDVVARSVNR